MKVVFSAAARKDLLEIGDYIAIDNPQRAITFVRALREAARRIGDMPRAFPLVPRYERWGLRRCPHQNYLIFYTIEPSRIGIVHVLHAARDYEAILFPDAPPN